MADSRSMHSTISSTGRLRRRHWIALLGLLTAIVLLVLHEPALANKFETIGGGVSGSRQLKLDWLQNFLYVVSGLCLLGAVLVVVVPRNNASYLNFANWKQSAFVLTVLAAASLGGALLI